ncbi:MAG TPA: cell wall-binding repeat-containing protein [Desulfosporosinus sp.]
MKKRFILIFSLVAMLSFTSSAYASSTNRLAGETRYDTSAAIAQSGWQQSDFAILAYGENYPDALSAAPLAKKYNAPILLTSGKNLPGVTKQRLTDLQIKNVFIIGGTAVIPTSIDQELKSMGITTTRIAGQDRYETSIKIAQRISSPSELIVTTGEDYPDALSMAPIAGAKQIPIILVPKASLPDSVKDYLSSIKVNKTYVIGDSSIIGDGVCNQFPNVERIVGADKYQRNIAINKKFDSDLKSSSLCIATGEGFADALTGAAYAAKISAPIILVKNASPMVTKYYYQQHLNNADSIHVFGGTGVISESLIQGLKDSTSVEIPPAPVVPAVVAPPIQISRSASSKLVENALSLQGIRYVYGGTSRSGFDCSGYVQYVFKGSGISLPRIASDQANVGTSVSQDQIQAGDLVFFTTYAPGASHVGIAIGGGSFVHASNSGVCISSLSESYYSGRFFSARRVS